MHKIRTVIQDDIPGDEFATTVELTLLVGWDWTTDVDMENTDVDVDGLVMWVEWEDEDVNNLEEVEDDDALVVLEEVEDDNDLEVLEDELELDDDDEEVDELDLELELDVEVEPKPDIATQVPFTALQSRKPATIEHWMLHV